MQRNRFHSSSQTFRLEEVQGGTRLFFEQTGFEGLEALMVRAILKSGFKKMYTRLLPALLAELDGDPRQDSASEPAACGGPLHRARLFVMKLFRRN